MARTAGARVVPFGLVLGLLALLAVPRAAPAQEVRYFYDALHRLVGVMDPQGNAAEYRYDAVGNLLQIRRYTGNPTTPVAILLVRPGDGTAHTPVEIYGKGFSPVPAENQVAFNGVAAVVTAATESTLVTTVPAGATTGPLTVTAPLGSATSPEPFTVLGGFLVVPDQADVPFGATLGFQATLGGTPTTAVTWRVNGTADGSWLFGTITATGVYTGPALPPPVPTITVEAVRTAAPTWVARATVRLVQPGGTLSARPVAIALAVNPAAQTVSVPVSLGVAGMSGGQLGGAPVSVTAAPVVTAVAPAAGLVGQVGLAVTLIGAHLQGATTVQFLQNGIPDPTLTATAVTPAGDGASLTCTITISGSASPGRRVLQAGSVPTGMSTAFDVGANAFTVYNTAPAATVLTAPAGNIGTPRPTYLWSAVPTATDYYLAVSDNTDPAKIRLWYTAAQAQCASGTGICQATPNVALAYGPATARVQTRNLAGDGPWSTDQAFAVIRTASGGVYRPTTGTWYLDTSRNGQWDGCGPDACLSWGGDPSDVPIVGDWTGSGPAKIGVYRAGLGTWYLDTNGNGTWDGCGPDACLSWGGDPSDVPIVGDWTGSGPAKIGVFRPSAGIFYLDYNGNGSWDGCGTDWCLSIGMAGDAPVVGDWNGSGTAKVGTFRPSNGTFYLDYNGNGSWDGCGTDWCLSIGMAGDVPVVGDWNGSGPAKVGVFRPSDGTFYLDYNGNGSWDGCGTDRCLAIGMAGDRPVVGDWNGSGPAKVGVFRPADGTFYLDYNGNGSWDGCGTDWCLMIGLSGDTPVVGKW